MYRAKYRKWNRDYSFNMVLSWPMSRRPSLQHSVRSYRAQVASCKSEACYCLQGTDFRYALQGVLEQRKGKISALLRCSSLLATFFNDCACLLFLPLHYLLSCSNTSSVRFAQLWLLLKQGFMVTDTSTNGTWIISEDCTSVRVPKHQSRPLLPKQTLRLSLLAEGADRQAVPEYDATSPVHICASHAIPKCLMHLEMHSRANCLSNETKGNR